MSFVDASCNDLRMVDTTENAAQQAFHDAQQLWRGALEAHRVAPPDAGFSARFRGLRLRRGRRLRLAGWRTVRGLGGRRIGRRRARRRMSCSLVRAGVVLGELWRRFDAAVSELTVRRPGRTCSRSRSRMTSSRRRPGSWPSRSSVRIARAACFRARAVRRSASPLRGFAAGGSSPVSSQIERG